MDEAPKIAMHSNLKRLGSLHVQVQIQASFQCHVPATVLRRRPTGGSAANLRLARQHSAASLDVKGQRELDKVGRKASSPKKADES